MLWYLLRTWSGREDMLVKEIQKTVPSYLYQEVFVIYNERIWRRQGESIIHAEPLFPGCVFLTCEKTDPFFMYIQRVPAMSALLASGELSVYPLMDADTEFLEQITDESHVIRLSYVLREEDHTYLVDGSLADLIPDITGIEFRKRFVKIQKRLWGEEQVLALGIRLNEDLDQAFHPSKRCTQMKIETSNEGRKLYKMEQKLTLLPEYTEGLSNRYA